MSSSSQEMETEVHTTDLLPVIGGTASVTSRRRQQRRRSTVSRHSLLATLAAGKSLACRREAAKLKSPIVAVPVIINDVVVDLTDDPDVTHVMYPENSGGDTSVIDVSGDEAEVESKGYDATPVEASKVVPVTLFPKITFRVRSLTENDPGVKYSLKVNENFMSIYYDYAARVDRLPD